MSRSATTLFGFVAIVLTFMLLGASAQVKGKGPSRWEPKPTTAAWQWQLQGKVETGVPAAVYDVDGFETPGSTVRRLHRQGRKAICYLDVGSWETLSPRREAVPPLGDRAATTPASPTSAGSTSAASTCSRGR